MTLTASMDPKQASTVFSGVSAPMLTLPSVPDFGGADFMSAIAGVPPSSFGLRWTGKTALPSDCTFSGSSLAVYFTDYPLPYSYQVVFAGNKVPRSLYYGRRDYNPEIGRWLSRDLIGIRGGKNLYGFVRNSPMSLIDGLGKSEYPPSPEDDMSLLLIEHEKLDVGLCGEFSWVVNFRITQAGPDWGIALQNIDINVTAFNCHNEVLYQTSEERNNESWYNEPNTSGLMRDGADNWARGPTSCSWGIGTISADAAYFTEPGFVYNEADVTSYITESGAPMYHEYSGPVPERQTDWIRRSISFSWDCCSRDWFTSIDLIELPGVLEAF